MDKTCFEEETCFVLKVVWLVNTFGSPGEATCAAMACSEESGRFTDPLTDSLGQPEVLSPGKNPSVRWTEGSENSGWCHSVPVKKGPRVAGWNHRATAQGPRVVPIDTVVLPSLGPASHPTLHGHCCPLCPGRQVHLLTPPSPRREVQGPRGQSREGSPQSALQPEDVTGMKRDLQLNGIWNPKKLGFGQGRRV